MSTSILLYSLICLVRPSRSDTMYSISFKKAPEVNPEIGTLSSTPHLMSSYICAAHDYFEKWFRLFLKWVTSWFFRKESLKIHWQGQLSSIDDETRSHQKCTDIKLHSTHSSVCDVTGQLVNIPQCPTASGGYGYIWKCDLTKDGVAMKVAAKSIKLQGSGSNDARRVLKRSKRELNIWARLRHRHILPLYGVAHNFVLEITVMVSPWLENGPVTSFISSNPDLSGSHRLQLVSDVADGLRYLHSQSIVHGDLTGSNVLICAQGRAHLADFGLSMLLTDTSTMSYSLTECAQWAAPELIEPPEDYINPWKLLSFQSDMYSFGSIMFHILSGLTPYQNMSNIQVIRAIMGGEKPSRPEHRQIIDEHWNFIQRCWLPAEKRCFRPSADSAYKFVQACRRERVSTFNV